MSGASTGLTLAGVFLCEVSAALLVGAGGRPLAGIACVAAALALAVTIQRIAAKARPDRDQSITIGGI